jgi:hypothetical protein
MIIKKAKWLKGAIVQSNDTSNSIAGSLKLDKNTGQFKKKRRSQETSPYALTIMSDK